MKEPADEAARKTCLMNEIPGVNPILMRCLQERFGNQA
jgi:hypothetical protein